MPTELTAARGAREEEAAPEGEAAETPEAAAAPAAAPGRIKAWLPLIVAVVTMPLLAFVTTRFVLLPRLQHSLAAQINAEVAQESAADVTAGKEGGKSAASKSKVMVPLNKMLVNVAGTMGTRYLMTSITLVGNTPDFKTKIEDNHDQLMDLATGTLSTKTISDLEKPGARNVIRSELIAVLNNALGGAVVQEIYITELAIQ